MTINIFVLKGDLNGKIVVVHFFFCRVYIFLTCCPTSDKLLKLHHVDTLALFDILRFNDCKRFLSLTQYTP